MSRDRELIPLVERLDSAVVACVGDLMLDHFVYGDVKRISPEAPIPVLRVDSQQSMLGGMGNVVRNLGALGCAIRVFAVVGDDDAGKQIDALLSTVPRCQTNIVTEPNRKTPVKTRFVANGQQLLRADHETSDPVLEESLTKLLEEYQRRIADCSVVVLSDYAKGMLLGHRAPEFIRIARQQGKRVVVDPKGTNYLRYQGATVIKPNQKELAEATSGFLGGTADTATAAHELLDQTGAENILVTRGSEGMLLVSHDRRILELPAMAKEVFDVSGAGDTVAATLAAALGTGAQVENAVRVANFAAGIVVAKAGTAIVERSEIVQEIEQQSALVANDKILRLAEVQERTAMWRRTGLKIGLVFGAFSSLSTQDLTLLEKARAACDRLIVAVQSDLALMDGSPLPSQEQNARAYLLASLVFSDAVIIFNSQNPETLLSDLQPDSFFTSYPGENTEVGESWKTARPKKQTGRSTQAALA